MSVGYGALMMVTAVWMILYGVRKTTGIGAFVVQLTMIAEDNVLCNALNFLGNLI
jgi:hypothetical protein